jgi:hypothetical protein
VRLLWSRQDDPPHAYTASRTALSPGCRTLTHITPLVRPSGLAIPHCHPQRAAKAAALLSRHRSRRPVRSSPATPMQHSRSDGQRCPPTAALTPPAPAASTAPCREATSAAPVRRAMEPWRRLGARQTAATRCPVHYFSSFSPSPHPCSLGLTPTWRFCCSMIVGVGSSSRGFGLVSSDIYIPWFLCPWKKELQKSRKFTLLCQGYTSGTHTDKSGRAAGSHVVGGQVWQHQARARCLRGPAGTRRASCAGGRQAWRARRTVRCGCLRHLPRAPPQLGAVKPRRNSQGS